MQKLLHQFSQNSVERWHTSQGKVTAIYSAQEDVLADVFFQS